MAQGFKGIFIFQNVDESYARKPCIGTALKKCLFRQFENKKSLLNLVYSNFMVIYALELTIKQFSKAARILS